MNGNWLLGLIMLALLAVVGMMISANYRDLSQEKKLVKRELILRVRPTLYDIVENGWSQKVLNKYSNPHVGINRWLKNKENQERLASYHKIGEIVQYYGVQYFKFRKTAVGNSATVVARVDFKQMNANITINFVEYRGQWYLSGMRVRKVGSEKKGIRGLKDSTRKK